MTEVEKENVRLRSEIDVLKMRLEEAQKPGIVRRLFGAGAEQVEVK